MGVPAARHPVQGGGRRQGCAGEQTPADPESRTATGPHEAGAAGHGPVAVSAAGGSMVLPFDDAEAGRWNRAGGLAAGLRFARCG